MDVGIVGYGAYVPRRRIKVEEIAKVWGADAPSYKKGLMLREKSVPAPDQDTITMSVEAARHAVRRAGIDPALIGAIYLDGGIERGLLVQQHRPEDGLLGFGAVRRLAAAEGVRRLRRRRGGGRCGRHPRSVASNEGSGAAPRGGT